MKNILSVVGLAAGVVVASGITGCAAHASVAATTAAQPAPAPPPPVEVAPPAPPAPPPPAPPPPPPPPPPVEAHPAYLHALSDLRNARANLERKGGDHAMKWDEHMAIADIDRAIADIKQAAIDDGKNLEDHPAVDDHAPRAGRLHAALDALRAARKDIEHEEDNAGVKGLRARANHDIDEAIHKVEQGINAAAQAS
jgi:type IV secretory pathway VirB10-like protein